MRDTPSISGHDVVDDLFELVQLDAGAIEVEGRRVELEDVVGSAVSTIAVSAREKGLRLETHLVGVSGDTCPLGS